MNHFEKLGVDKNIVKAVTDLGFNEPTSIQREAIPLLLSGSKDLIGLAQTGTGKTAAFGLPLIQQVEIGNKHTQALIICPTRELCLQITRDLKNFSKYIPSVTVVAVYGGASIEKQISEIARGAQIIVATPGRMVDVIKRKKVNLNHVKYTVLDEADEMLNMGFKEDLDTILSQTPSEKNTWLFSATMPPEISRIAQKYMNNPDEVTVGRKNQSAENIEHKYYVVHAKDKYLALKRIVDFYPDIFGIVFCRTRLETQQIAEHLMKDGYNADALHGDLSQQQRDYVMKRYRNRTLQLLIATDVAARGIDVNDVTHVIHYSLPDDVENYTHRSGRTARAGKSGVSIAIIHLKEVGKIREIERKVGKKVTYEKVPDGITVCEKQLFHLISKIHDVQVKEEEIQSFLPQVNEMLQDLSKEELIKRMVSIEFNRFLEYYKNAPDLNADIRRERTSTSSYQREYAPTGRFFINIGEMDGLSLIKLRDFICDVTTLDRGSVGKINIKNTFSFFEVDPSLSEFVLKAFQRQKFNGRNVRVEFVNSPNRDKKSITEKKETYRERSSSKRYSKKHRF